MDGIGPADGEPGSGEELRQLEQRVDARFEAIDRRFTQVGTQLEELDERIAGIERAVSTMDQYSRRFASVDSYLDANRSQIDHVRMTLVAQIDDARRHLMRQLILGVIATAIVSAVLYLGTLALVR